MVIHHIRPLFHSHYFPWYLGFSKERDLVDAGEGKENMTDQELASTILQLVGGEENVNSLKHCATRLRFKIKVKIKVKIKDINVAAQN